jgi:hypothetical protein
MHPQVTEKGQKQAHCSLIKFSDTENRLNIYYGECTWWYGNFAAITPLEWRKICTDTLGALPWLLFTSMANEKKGINKLKNYFIERIESMSNNVYLHFS